MKIVLAILLLSFQAICFAQVNPANLADINDDDIKIGGDIFTDFNEDLDATHVIEDERYYRYGRFFTVALSLGMTAFNGNRGLAYENEHPSFGLALNVFQDFQSSFGLGFAYSKHHMQINVPTEGSVDAGGGTGDNDGFGFITVNMLRVFFSYRYYIDTSNLGTAITYSNPYFIGRIEYWYQTNKYVDQPVLADDSGGAIGFGVGGGLEFPLKLQESYLGIEMLMHSAAFFDKYTQMFKGKTPGTGYEDLTGYAFTTMISYVINW